MSAKRDPLLSHDEQERIVRLNFRGAANLSYSGGRNIMDAVVAFYEDLINKGELRLASARADIVLTDKRGYPWGYFVCSVCGEQYDTFYNMSDAHCAGCGTRFSIEPDSDERAELTEFIYSKKK